MASVYVWARRDRATNQILNSLVTWHRPSPKDTAAGWYEVLRHTDPSTAVATRRIFAWLRQHIGSDLVAALPAETLRAVTEGLFATADGQAVAA